MINEKCVLTMIRITAEAKSVQNVKIITENRHRRCD